MNRSSKQAIIVMNTGTPKYLNKTEVQRFIGDMLSDPYVMGLPGCFRTLLAKGIIAPMRASASLKKYASFWGEASHSPLWYHLIDLCDHLQSTFGIPVMAALRYGDSLDKAVQQLKKLPLLEEVILLPLFPQYAASSYQTVVACMQKIANENGWRLQTVAPFYNNPLYIEALANSLQPALNRGMQHLVFSYHSLPMSHIMKGRQLGEAFDYEYQCRETVRLVAEQLSLSPGSYSIAFASAIGKKWLKPFLDEHLEQLINDGVQQVAVITPGFLQDNMETLYDIDIEIRQLFEQKKARN